MHPFLRGMSRVFYPFSRFSAGKLDDSRSDAEFWRDAYNRLVGHLEDAQAEVEKLRAGEDNTPLEECMMASAGQFYRQLHDAIPEKRMEMLRQLFDDSDKAFRCFLTHHDYDYLHRRIQELVVEAQRGEKLRDTLNYLVEGTEDMSISVSALKIILDATK